MKTGDKVRESTLGQMETNTWVVSLLIKGKDREICNKKALESNTLEVGKTIRNKAMGLRQTTMNNTSDNSSTIKNMAKESLTTREKKETASFQEFG